MADRLYLSLWYPNFRLEALPAALTGVLRQFALVGGKRVAAASAYPINFTQPPTYQRIYVDTGPHGTDSTRLHRFHPRRDRRPPRSRRRRGHRAAPRRHGLRVRDALAALGAGRTRRRLQPPGYPPRSPGAQAHDPDFDPDADSDEPAFHDPDAPWKLRTHTVRILGFGPNFDVAGYEQNGHLLVDFGLDTPWVLDSPLDDEPLDEEAQLHIQQNVEKLLAFTLLVEKNCGISSRLLWTESGEPLAEKLIARLQRVN